MGLCTLFMNPSRIRKAAAALKPATLLDFHQVLKERKYRRLFSPERRGKPGPKGPSKELIEAIVEMKRRNPRSLPIAVGRVHRTHTPFVDLSELAAVPQFVATFPPRFAKLLAPEALRRLQTRRPTTTFG
jgi:hypothetical protein